MPRYYAGIGSRETPATICQMMGDFAGELSQRDFILRSGHAAGADLAFENGSCVSKQEIYLPWLGFNAAVYDTPLNAIITLGHPNEEKFAEIAKRHHGNWGVCNPAAKKLLTRNVPIILGQDLKSPAEFVISWTHGGQQLGGTAHAMKIAEHYKIPVFNLGDRDGLTKLIAFAKGL